VILCLFFRDVINEWYVADTSRKIKAVFKSRMEKGLRCSGSVCYGYRASKEEKGEWIIDEEAAVVRRIFQSVLAGENHSQHSKGTPRRKIPIPSEHWKRAHQSQATKKSRQKMYEEAATGNPEAVEHYENYLATRRESYHRKKQEAERTA